MIGDTLRASLKGEQRRNHELYNHEKLNLLYSEVLSEDKEEENDDHLTQVEKLILELNKRAADQIEKGEKIRSKKAK